MKGNRKHIISLKLPQIIWRIYMNFPFSGKWLHPSWENLIDVIKQLQKNYIQNSLFDMEMREMNSVPLDNPSPTLSYSVTPSTSYFPGSSPQSCQSVNSDYSNTSINQLHDTTYNEIQDLVTFNANN